MLSFVDNVIAGLPAVDLFAFFQLRNDRVGFVVFVGGFIRRTGNDQRRARFVDENRIDFVNDREVMTALNTSREVKLHIVAQIVEAEFVVGAVGDVRGLSGLDVAGGP